MTHLVRQHGGTLPRRPATVSWRTPDGERRSERTATPTRLVKDLADAYGEIPELTVTRPTLEDIYLTMIGEREAT